MRIKGLNLPAEYAQVWGLDAISMSRLGRVVALAGKNGSGKSRILAAVEYTSVMRNNALSAHDNDVVQKRNYEEAIKRRPIDIDFPAWQRELKAINDRQMWFDRVQVDRDSDIRAIRFVPKKLDFVNPMGLPPQDLLMRFERTKTTDVSKEISNTCLSYIQQCQSRFWNATHPGYRGSQDHRQSAVSDYESLNRIVFDLLASEITRSIDDVAQIFDKNIFEANLSDGQKVLLQLAVALHAQKTNLNDSFLILDEPENHLHPSVAVDVLEKLLQVVPDSQIWVATHSVPLLAYVLSKDPMALWYVSNGSVAHAGRNPGLVLESLLGSEERIGQLHAFTSLPAQLAAVNYAAESLISPQVVPYGGTDVQINQIHQALARLSSGRAVRMLDFGAGKGRLLEGLAALEANNFVANIDYFALDASAADAEICNDAIKQLYGEDRVRHFSTIDEILNELSSSFFDVVVMCNVLHEISPVEWSGLFSEGSALHRAISSNGYLLVVEDLRIPTGEKAHECGFLVLDTQHLKTLFGVLAEDVRDERFISSDARGDGRLKAHLISKSLLSKMNVQTRTQAIEGLADTAHREIQALRNKPAVYSNGMLHGFWTQQFANAAIYLRTVK